jgi:hypothetical protein
VYVLTITNEEKQQWIADINRTKEQYFKMLSGEKVEFE